MQSDRDKTLREAMDATSERSRSARAGRRSKIQVTKPWRVLEESWHEQMRLTFGKKYQSSPWGVAETSLAKALLKEVDLETATKMVQAFIPAWKKDGTPGFGYFWKARDSYRAIALGQVKSKRERINQDEFNEARDGHLPDIGW
jgi:hypothetical protein